MTAGDAFTARKLAWLDAVSTDNDLSSSAVRIAVRLAHWVSREKGYAYPSIARLTEETGLKKSAVKSAISQLEERDHLEADRRGGRGQNSRFWIVLDGEKESENPAPNEGKESGIPAPIHQKESENPAPIAEKGPDSRSKGAGNLAPTPLSKPIDRSLTDSIDHIFEEHFWPPCLKKVGKAAAKKVFKQKVKAGHDPYMICAANRRYQAEMAGKDPRYVKHPSGWIRDERYFDEPAPVPKQLDRSVNGDRIRPSAATRAVHQYHGEWK